MERGTLIAGKYELRERLGRGGMGEVWAGRDRDLHRNVAIKLLAGDDDGSPDLLHRFEREAVAAAQINHPNVVSLYDRGIHDGLQFLVMEHIDGTTLARHMHEQTPMPPARALEITQEICAALVAAHRAKVVHYDIKPSNVMLTADGRIKVVDFGIAGFTHTHTFTVVPTSMLAPVGTARYGAPEQFLDQRGDERSDLYALGGVLFALLTGKPPFGDGSPLAVIRRKLDDEPPPLHSLRPDVPESVAQLLTDLLQRDPDRRPQTASAVYQRLEQLQSAISTPGAGAREPDTEREPQTAPTRVLTKETRPDTEDAFEITWTGQGPISTYVTDNRGPLVLHWLLFAVLALPLLFLGTGLVTVMVSEGEPVDDLSNLIFVFLVVYAMLLPLMYGWKLGAATGNNRRPLVRDWLRLAVLMLPLLCQGTTLAVAVTVTRDPVKDIVLPISVFFMVYAMLLPLIHGWKLGVATGNWRRHRRALKEKHPWSLRVDAAGITTTDPRHATPVGGPAGRRTYGWDLVTVVTLERAAKSRWSPDYAALHIQPRAEGVTVSPAGMAYTRSPQGKAGRRPLCALGPMTEQQHEALIATLARHAGSRWKPELSE